MSYKASKWIKSIALILAMCMLMCFTGCSGGDEDSSSSDTSGTGEQTEYHKVGFIFSGKADGNNFTSQVNEQRIMAANRSGMDTCYIENVPISGFETAVKKLADAGCTDIVSCSSTFTNVARVISNKYMNINFISYGATSGSANCIAYTEQPYQGAYAAGMIAGFNSKSLKIGFVADSDMIYDTAVANAAALGAQRVVKNVVMYLAEAHADSEIKEAINSLLGRGCDVIINYTDSMYSADYCQQKGVKFIDNHNWSGKTEAYSKMLMYYYCKRDSYFLAKFKQMNLGQWEPENYTGTMGNGIVTVSDALGDAKDGSQKIRDAIVPHLSTGAEYIFKGELIQNNGVVRYLQIDEMSSSEIYNMDWYVKGVETIGSFRKPRHDTAANDFTVKE